MDLEKLKGLSTEELTKKKKSIKVMMGIFYPIILALAYFNLKDYMNDEFDVSSSIITICSIGGLATLFPELKKVKEELGRRN